MKKIYIQIGAGAGDLDSRINFRDGFTELVKKQDPSTIERILLIEPNPSNIPNLKECWKDYPQAEIYELGICLKSDLEKFITFYYAEEDAPHFQTFSMKEEHVRDHYRTEEIKSKVIECKTLEDFLNENISEGTIIDVLGLDIEGIDAEVILENDWNKINCRYLSIEHIHLHDNKELVVKRLTDSGYVYHGNGLDPNYYDWAFIKSFD